MTQTNTTIAENVKNAAVGSKDQKGIMTKIKNTFLETVGPMLYARGRGSDAKTEILKEALDFGRQFTAFCIDRAKNDAITVPNNDSFLKNSIILEQAGKKEVRDSFLEMIADRIEVFTNAAVIMNNNSGRLENDTDPRTFTTLLLSGGESKREQLDKGKACYAKEAAKVGKDTQSAQSVHAPAQGQSAK